MIPFRAAILIVIALFAANVPDAAACATCFGASDSPMAQGMNWGIFTLLVVITSVLALIAGFFIFLARRSAQMAASSAPKQHPHERI